MAWKSQFFFFFLLDPKIKLSSSLERTSGRGVDQLPCKAVLDTALPYTQVTLLQLDAVEGPAIKGNVSAEIVLL